MTFKQVLNKVASFYTENKLTIWLIIGVICGVILGIVLTTVNPYGFSSRHKMYIGYLGTMFLQMLRFISLPLMATCLVCAFATMDSSVSKRVGVQFGLFFVVTKIQATILGIVTAVILQPGVGLQPSKDDPVDALIGSGKITAVDSLLDIVRNLFPSNIVDMVLRTYRTVLTPENGTSLTEWDVVPGGEMVKGSNLLGLISISIIVGIAVNSADEGGRAFFDLINCANKVTFKVTMWIMLLAPVCLMSLVAAEIMKMQNIQTLLKTLGLFLAGVVVAESTQLLIIYPLIYLAIVRKNPFVLYEHGFNALVTAFATDSSVATIPFTIKCMEENANMEPKFVRFIIPVAHNINKDGTAIFLGYSAIYVFQLHSRPIGISEFMIVGILSATGSIAAAPVPFASLIVLTTILQAVSLPISDVGLLMAIDWLDDRLRTVLNCAGDMIGLGIVDKYNKVPTPEG